MVKKALLILPLCLCFIFTGCMSGVGTKMLDERELLSASPAFWKNETNFPELTESQEASRYPLSGEQWWLDVLHVQRCWEEGLDGTGVLVAILDSGLDYNHPDLAGANLMEGYNATGFGEQTDVTDYLGHGTYITGLLAIQHDNMARIKGLMPGATYLPIKVTNAADSVKISAVVDGLAYAVSQNADVAILCLGLQENIPEFEQAIQKAADVGMLLFAAVGNNGDAQLFYPAAYVCVIGVGSCNLLCEPSETSQYNESVSVLAPGVKITSIWSSIADGSAIYRTETGTSYAVPQAAAMGITAKMIWPDIGYSTFMPLLSEFTKDIGTAGYDIASGWGLIDFNLFCDMVRNSSPHH